MISSMLPSATALQLGISASYSATAAALVFKNNAPAGSFSPRCYLRDIHFLVAAAPASGTGLLYATVLDNVNRAPTTVSGLGSPGTPAKPDGRSGGDRLRQYRREPDDQRRLVVPPLDLRRFASSGAGPGIERAHPRRQRQPAVGHPSRRRQLGRPGRLPRRVRLD
jgi:hypothetical protein